MRPSIYSDPLVCLIPWLRALLALWHLQWLLAKNVLAHLIADRKRQLLMKELHLKRPFRVFEVTFCDFFCKTSCVWTGSRLRNSQIDVKSESDMSFLMDHQGVLKNKSNEELFGRLCPRYDDPWRHISCQSALVLNPSPNVITAISQRHFTDFCFFFCFPPLHFNQPSRHSDHFNNSEPYFSFFVWGGPDKGTYCLLMLLRPETGPWNWSARQELTWYVHINILIICSMEGHGGCGTLVTFKRTQQTGLHLKICICTKVPFFRRPHTQITQDPVPHTATSIFKV